MKPTYLFYDIETTGLNVAFDQVLQFAAIRTDMEFNKLERHDIRIKLRDDVIPSPYAIITHLMSFEQMKTGECEAEAIQHIHQLLNRPGTISLGYNTLGFDDEFLRFSFYRNLLTPYTHQYANQCSRMDIYPIMLFYYLYKNDCGLVWPTIEGKLSLRLEHLNAANALAKGQAHEAMADVEATIALAKRLRQSETLWQYCTAYFNKKIDEDRLIGLSEGLWVQGNLGIKNNFQAPVIHLGQHVHYKNQSVFLRLDLPELAQTTPQTIEKTTWTLKKKLGEPGFVLPPLERFLTKLSNERQTIAHQNKTWLANHPIIFDAIKTYHLNFKYPIVPNADVDAILYQNGFLSPHDQQLCQQFHQIPLKDRPALISQLESIETQELAWRLLARNYAEQLSFDDQGIYQAYLEAFYANQPIVDYKNSQKLNPSTALQEITALQHSITLSEQQKQLLEEYSNYLNTLNFTE